MFHTSKVCRVFSFRHLSYSRLQVAKQKLGVTKGLYISYTLNNKACYRNKKTVLHKKNSLNLKKGIKEIMLFSSCRCLFN